MFILHIFLKKTCIFRIHLFGSIALTHNLAIFDFYYLIFKLLY